MTASVFVTGFIDLLPGASDDVSAEFDVFNNRSRAVIGTCCKENGRTILSHRPVVGHKVVCHLDVSPILYLEQILNDPGLTHPLNGLIEIVISNDAIGRNELQIRSGSAEEYVLRRCFEIVVRYLHRAVRRPGRDRLALLALSLDVRDIAVSYFYIAAVSCDPAALAFGRAAMDIYPVKFDMMRKIFDRSLLGRAYSHDVPDSLGRRADLDCHEPKMMGPARGQDGRFTFYVRLQFRQAGSVFRRIYPHTRRYKSVGSGRPNGNESITRFLGQLERSRESCARLQLDRIAGFGAVERGLKIPAGFDRYDRTRMF